MNTSVKRSIADGYRGTGERTTMVVWQDCLYRVEHRKRDFVGKKRNAIALERARSVIDEVWSISVQKRNSSVAK
jgi:hypothetical protein